MQIELMDVGALAPYEKNSRTHPPKQVKALRKSIESFGFAGAIVIRNGTIAKGHATLEAAKAIYADGRRLYPPPGKKGNAKPFPAGTVPVIDCSGWTEQQFKAFVIADNRLAEMSAWDKIMLVEELPEIKDIDISGLLNDDLDMGSLLEVHNLGTRYDFSAEAREGLAHDTEPEAGMEADEDAEVGSNGRHPVTFMLGDSEHETYMALKKAHRSINPKTVFLRGMEAIENGS